MAKHWNAEAQNSGGRMDEDLYSFSFLNVLGDNY
jgi:hypothetical protein